MKSPIQILVSFILCCSFSDFVFAEGAGDMKARLFWNAEKPEGGADWFLQTEIKFLFPKQ